MAHTITICPCCGVDFMFHNSEIERLRVFPVATNGAGEPVSHAPVCYVCLEQMELMLEYPLQDDTWPSRRWNKDRTDYIDLSGDSPRSAYLEYKADTSAAWEQGMVNELEASGAIVPDNEAQKKPNTIFLRMLTYDEFITWRHDQYEYKINNQREHGKPYREKTMTDIDSDIRAIEAKSDDIDLPF